MGDLVERAAVLREGSIAWKIENGVNEIRLSLEEVWRIALGCGLCSSSTMTVLSNRSAVYMTARR